MIRKLAGLIIIVVLLKIPSILKVLPHFCDLKPSTALVKPHTHDAGQLWDEELMGFRFSFFLGSRVQGL